MRPPIGTGVVIAGGGLAGQRCAETLRRCGYDGAIRMVCAERHLPYDRPALSKEVLGDENCERSLFFRSPAWYSEQAVELTLGVRAAKLDTVRRTLRLSDGTTLPYEHLLLATGARARRLALFEGYANVSTLRTLEDAGALRRALLPGARLLVVGAGFIGQEAAAAARRAGAEVTLVEPAQAPLISVLGPELGRWFADLHRSEGVDLRLGEQVLEVSGDGVVVSVTLSSGQRVSCDHVLLGVGVEPELEWLAGSGLDPRGVRTDTDGRTDVPAVYAAGDAAATFDRVLERHVVGGHWEAAGRQGARAARAMLGLKAGRLSVASFWSDLYGTRVQYLGHAELAEEVCVEGDRDGRDFIATFTHEDRPVAVLLAGRPHALPEARGLLSQADERIFA